jgi:hypothetical protein
MNESIEMEIVRLIKEISEDERKLVSAETQESCFSTESGKRKYTMEAKRYRDSIERKMNLLKLLKE